MNIAAGKQYLDRKGNLWSVISITPGYVYPALARKADGQTDSFMLDGRWSRHVEWHNDLMSEVSASVVTEDAA